jgi:hypothetical protein
LSTFLVVGVVETCPLTFPAKEAQQSNKNLKQYGNEVFNFWKKKRGQVSTLDKS